MSKMIWRNSNGQPIKKEDGFVMLAESCCCCGCVEMPIRSNNPSRSVPCLSGGMLVSKYYAVDDIGIVSAKPISYIYPDLVAESGFVLAATDGGLSGLCNTDGWSITIGGNTVGGSGRDYSCEEFNAMCIAAGMRVVYPGEHLTEAEMIALGFTTGSAYAATKICGTGYIRATLYFNPAYIAYERTFDCEGSSWGALETQDGMCVNEWPSYHELYEWDMEINGAFSSSAVTAIYTAKSGDAPPADMPPTPYNHSYYWEAYYDCFYEEWYIYNDCDNGCCHITPFAANEWIETDDGGYYMFTETNTEPAPPPAPRCVYEWYAYYDCDSATWYVDSWPYSWTGDDPETDWIVNDTYASKITTSSTQPAEPTETPAC